MYELKKIERYLPVNLLRPGPRLMKKRIYLAAVAQRLRSAILAHTLATNKACVTSKYVYLSFGFSADPSRSVTGWFLILEGTAGALGIFSVYQFQF